MTGPAGGPVVPLPVLPVPDRPPRWALVWAESDKLAAQMQDRRPVLRVVGPRG
jgi:hypothetical protein